MALKSIFMVARRAMFSWSYFSTSKLPLPPNWASPGRRRKRRLVGAAVWELLTLTRTSNSIALRAARPNSLYCRSPTSDKELPAHWWQSPFHTPSGMRASSRRQG